MALTEVLEDIELAFVQLEFAIRLLSYCDLGKLNPQDFDDDHVVRLCDGDLNFPAGQFADAANIVRSASIGVLLAAGATALAINRGFDEVGPKPDPTSDDNVVRLRTLVYMVRSAYAHDIAAPQWEVRGPFLRELAVSLNGEPLVVDLTKLHGTPFAMEQIGGYSRWLGIRRASVEYLKTKL